MIDRGVAFALNVTISRDYRWTEYVSDLYRRMLSASPAPASLPSEEASTPDGVIQAMAASDAKFDGREWLGMSRTDRERYLDRSRASFAAALGSVLNPLR